MHTDLKNLELSGIMKSPRKSGNFVLTFFLPDQGDKVSRGKVSSEKSCYFDLEFF